MRSRRSITILAMAALFIISSTVVAVEKKTDDAKVKEASTSATVTTTKSTQDQIAELKAKLEEAAATGSTPRTGEQINWQVISGGATNGSSTNFSLMGTIGQTAVGMGSSTNYGVNHGYWQNFSSSGSCCDNAGDFNHDGSVDISDLTAMVDFMFGGGAAAVCQDEADVDDSGGVDITDLTIRVDFMFGGGPPLICGTTGI